MGAWLHSAQLPSSGPSSHCLPPTPRPCPAFGCSACGGVGPAHAGAPPVLGQLPANTQFIFGVQGILHTLEVVAHTAVGI